MLNHKHLWKLFAFITISFSIATVPVLAQGKKAKIVREAQVKVANADKNVGWFDTDDVSMWKRGHYCGKALIEIGKRFAAIFQEIADGADSHQHKKGKK